MSKPCHNDWIDYATNEDVDRHGCPIIGVDDGGYWIGTEAALCVLGDPSEDGPDCSPATPRAWHVTGMLGAEDIEGHFVASEAVRALNYVRGLGAREVEASGGEPVPGTWEPYDTVHVE